MARMLGRALLPWLAVLLHVAAAALARPSPGRPHAGTFTRLDGVRGLVELDRLPRLDDSRWSGVTTWNPEGRNGDGDNYLARLDERTVLLADFEGPGCVTRFRAGNAVGRWRIEVDGETVYDASGPALFSADEPPFRSPLAQQTPRRSYVSFVPMGFQRSFRVTAEAYGNGPRALPRFFQAAVRHFPPETAVEPFSLEWSAAELAELERVAEAWRDPGAARAPDAAVPRRRRALTLGPGAPVELAALEGAGVVRELRLRLASADPFALRTTRLVARWDGAEQPAVDAPVGAFFATDAGGLEFHTLPMGMERDGTHYCRLPMPFRDGARLALSSSSAHPVEVELELAVESFDTLPAGTGYLHARWRAELTDGPPEEPNLAGLRNHLIASASGRGRYVGTHLDVFHFAPGWWGEGDPFLWLDAEPDTWPPTFHGTGTEEYFNGGWRGFNALAVSGFVPLAPEQVGRDAFPYNPPEQPRGQGFAADVGPGRTLAHSFHLTDFPVFARSLHFSIEHGSNNRRRDRFASTAYLYLDRPGGQPPDAESADPFARAHVTLTEVLARRAAGGPARETLELVACFDLHRDPAARAELGELFAQPDLTELADDPRHAPLYTRVVRALAGD